VSLSGCCSLVRKALLFAVLALLGGCALVQEAPPPLRLKDFSADKISAGSTLMGPVRWTARTEGGSGPLSYEFTSIDGEGREARWQGGEESFEWRPPHSGTYRMKVAVRDQDGNAAESDWSAEFAVSRPRFAVLPLQNLSGGPAPLAAIRTSLLDLLQAEGGEVVSDSDLEKFMAAERMRNVGGIDGPLAAKMREATGAEAVLITSLELYTEQFPPRIALLARLVSLGEEPVILWMDSVGLAGDDRPGLLGLGLIEKPELLRDKALRRLVDSLKRQLAGEGQKLDAAGKFQPKLAYGSRGLDRERKYRVAVGPFFNLSDRKYGGEIMALHFVSALQKIGRFEVIEPGMVLTEMLRFRIIMDDGVSLPGVGNLVSNLEADFFLSGKVFDYQDPKGGWGMPVVDFSAEMIEVQNGEVVWTSKSYNAGTDGVFFFDWGRVTTASAMAAEMALAVSGLIAQ